MSIARGKTFVACGPKALQAQIRCYKYIIKPNSLSLHMKQRTVYIHFSNFYINNTYFICIHCHISCMCVSIKQQFLHQESNAFISIFFFSFLSFYVFLLYTYLYTNNSFVFRYYQYDKKQQILKNYIYVRQNQKNKNQKYQKCPH